MAVGRIRGFSGKLYVQYRQNQKEFLTAISEGQGTPEHGRYQSHQIDSLDHLDGATHSVGQRRVPALTRIDYSKVATCCKCCASNWWIRATRIPIICQGYDEGLLQDVRHKPASTEDFKSIVEKHMTATWT